MTADDVLLQALRAGPLYAGPESPWWDALHRLAREGKCRGDGWRWTPMTSPSEPRSPGTPDDDDAVWAHVIRESETEEPALLDDETLAEVNEAISDIIGGRYFLDRTWIQPGPLLEEPHV